MNSKALEAAARHEWKANFELGRIIKPREFDEEHFIDYLVARTQYIFAAYLDEAGTPIRWCTTHEEPMQDVHSDHIVDESCVIVDAVLVIGGNE